MSFVSYADDFVFMNYKLDVIKKYKEIISEFLADKGLELSAITLDLKF